MRILALYLIKLISCSENLGVILFMCKTYLLKIFNIVKISQIFVNRYVVFSFVEIFRTITSENTIVL